MSITQKPGDKAMTITRKPYKTIQERRDDAFAVGEPVWLFTGSDVIESEIVSLGTVLPGEKAPVYYHVRQQHVSPTKEYYRDLYHRPADLEDLMDAVEQARDSLGKALKDLEEQLVERDHAECCPVCGQVIGEAYADPPGAQSTRLTTCWSCKQ